MSSTVSYLFLAALLVTGSQARRRLFAELASYPGYGGPLSVTGRVSFTAARSDGLKVIGKFSGLEARVQGGIHVHVGSTCETAGGHYFEGLAEDPWLTTTYRTNQDGKGRTNFAIDGFTLSDERGIEGRTVVLHSVSGTRIACGVISGFEAAEPHEAQLEAYPGYQGQLQVTGSITFQDSKRGLKLFAKVNGLEQNTIGGIHVHVGSTCETAGGHYFDGLSSDPWTTTTYQSTATGYSRIRFRVADFSLTSERAVSGRTVVLHDSNGTRIACGVISPKA